MRSFPVGLKRPAAGSPLMRTAVAGAVACAAIVGGLSACSSGGSGDPLGGMDANQITMKAFSDLNTASSVHVTGPSNGGGTDYNLDVTLSKSDCQGTYATASKGTFHVLTLNGTTYFSANQLYWKSTGATGSNLSLLTSHYIKVGPNSQTLAALNTLCHPSQLAKSFTGQVSGMIDRGWTTINGQKVMHITDSGDASGIYVSDSATPEVIRLNSGSSLDLVFSDYNSPLNLTAPPASQVLDGKKMGF
ncbi:MAG TPA: hypothetical protein VFB06_20140 [Streptosporangiaceae bacterium]|nr:hypothetical protein [Streptosporangiaceae bacterium]